MKSYISTVAFPNTGGIIVSNYTQWRNSIPKGFRNMRSAFFKKSKAGKFVNPNLMFTQISQMTQIKNENKYGMNRMIWAEGRGLRAEGLGQRENRYGMNRMIWAEGRGLRAERK